MKLGLVIASHRRPDILHKVLIRLMSQPRAPDDIVISAVESADIPEVGSSVAKLHKIYGSAGSSCQRNRGIAQLIGTSDVIAFIDDDFIVGDDYFLNIERIFAQDEAIIGVNGDIVADGANGQGFTFEEGLQLAERYACNQQPPVIREIKGRYAKGCNGLIAVRTAKLGSLRFDEQLPLYAWQEDLDFCNTLCRTGQIVTTNLVWGVHLGTKRGKGSQIRLGYSQVVNPVYIVRKGNMSCAYAFRLVIRNFIANIIKSFRPESYIDRRGRLWGNLIGIFHLITGRLTPEYILKL